MKWDEVALQVLFLKYMGAVWCGQVEYGAVINSWCNIVRHFKEGAIGCGKHAVGAAPHPPHLKFGPGVQYYDKQAEQIEIGNSVIQFFDKKLSIVRTY